LQAEEDSAVEMSAERFLQGKSAAARAQSALNSSAETVEISVPAECTPKVLRRPRTSRGPRTSLGSERR
jgi:hypothetical protein